MYIHLLFNTVHRVVEGGAVRTVIGFWGQLSVFVQPELSVFVRSEFSICLELNPVFVSSAPKCIVLDIGGR